MKWMLLLLLLFKYMLLMVVVVMVVLMMLVVKLLLLRLQLRRLLVAATHGSCLGHHARIVVSSRSGHGGAGVPAESGGDALAGVANGDVFVDQALLLRLVAAVHLVLSDTAVLLDLVAVKTLEGRFKLDFVVVDPKGAGSGGEISIHVAAVTGLPDNLDAEHVVLAEDTVDGVAVADITFARALPVSDKYTGWAGADKGVVGVQREDSVNGGFAE